MGGGCRKEEVLGGKCEEQRKRRKDAVQKGREGVKEDE
jgi:hypothetical protein